MANRYNKFVYEDERGITFAVDAKKGITLEVSEGTSGELIIKAQQIATVNATTDVYSVLPAIKAGEYAEELPAIKAGEYAEELSVYTDKDGNRAVIPPGWVVSGVVKENTIWGKELSVVIYRIPKEKAKKIKWNNPDELDKLKRTYDQLVWCPVDLLDADGTLDGKNFNSKFGRRNYRNEEFSEEEFHEELEGELLEVSESVERYGGFYIARYNISEGEPRSIKGIMPQTKVNFSTSCSIALSIEKGNEFFQSHLTYGAENDTINAWLIKSGSKTLDEIAKDSTKWGNHWNTAHSPRKVVETGSREEWCANNIYDWAGNVDEWTQEKYGTSCRVIRGGFCYNIGLFCPVAARDNNGPIDEYFITGIRATFYIR